MTISADYGRQSPSAFWSYEQQGVRIPIDLVIVTLWAGIGLVLSAAVCAHGFGLEVGQFLALAG